MYLGHGKNLKINANRLLDTKREKPKRRLRSRMNHLIHSLDLSRHKMAAADGNMNHARRNIEIQPRGIREGLQIDLL